MKFVTSVSLLTAGSDIEGLYGEAIVIRDVLSEERGMKDVRKLCENLVIRGRLKHLIS